MSEAPEWLKDYRPTVLCMSSGALKGLEQLGAIYYFYLNGNLDAIDTYIGSSIGAIIGTLMALGYSPPEILEVAVETTLFTDIADLNFTRILDDFGLVSNTTFDDNLAKMMMKMIIAKVGKMPTLKEFYEHTKKRVVFCIVSLKDEKEMYADHNSKPDMPLIVALRATSNSPLIFGKLEHQKDFLVDGAVLDPFPILKLDDSHTEILGIAVVDKREWNHKTLTGLGYYDRIISLPLRRLTELSIASSSSKCYSMVIPVEAEMSMLDSGKNSNVRLDKFLAGYRYAEIHVVRNPPRKATKVDKELPITKSAILATLNTQPAKLLIKCMQENPELFSNCLSEMGISLPIVSEQSVVSEQPVANQSPLPIIEEPDDEILELPRMVTRHIDPPTIPFRFPFKQRSVPIPRPINIQIVLSPELLEKIFGVMMNSIRAIGGSSF